ncbi:hypothetical protein J2R98_001502 [Alkalibacillus filiformis]|uniref:Uncharacterized protein n=1 Tax=Alkalibacillus filiformis TaxID=200990 RepID=A0ABU0DU65_9BACI|nr:hypothetical protein [Alkalibacillus filiformis]MDQ0351685.1 hypothetical protein [Alkalibacillus filiformis]
MCDGIAREFISVRKDLLALGKIYQRSEKYIGAHDNLSALGRIYRRTQEIISAQQKYRRWH